MNFLGWHEAGNHPKCCIVPKHAEQSEIDIYHKWLDFHCDHPDKGGDHKCCGRITIAYKSVTVRCEKCGDAKVRLTNPPASRNK